VTMWTCSRH